MSTPFDAFRFFLPPLLAACALLLYCGRRRRIGADPYCRVCNYLLHGLESQRCPECGGTLSASNIVYGPPIRRWKTFLTGWAVLLLIGLSTGAGALSSVSHVNWYHYKPAYFVMRDLNSGESLLAQQAFTELLRREKTGSLSNRSRDRFVAFALKQQGSARSPFSQLDVSAANYLIHRWQSGTLSPELAKKFLGQMVQLQLRVRPKIIAGDDIPCATYQESGPSSQKFWIWNQVLDADIDGEKCPGPFEKSTVISRYGGSETMRSPQQYLPPGKHDLNLVVRVEVSGFPQGVGKSPHTVRSMTPLYHEDRKLSASFVVLENPPRDLIRPVSDPKLANAVRASITLRSFYFSHITGRLEGVVNLNHPPVNLAFDVFARCGGVVYHLATLTSRAGSDAETCTIGAQLTSAPPSTVDIVFLPSENLVRSSVDLYSFWDQEIVFENVEAAKL